MLFALSSWYWLEKLDVVEVLLIIPVVINV